MPMQLLCLIFFVTLVAMGRQPRNEATTHAPIDTLRASRWRWAVGGCFLSFLSTFFIPFNIIGPSAFEIWLTMVLFPYGMICRHHDVPQFIGAFAWSGPLIIYGLILSAVAHTRHVRLTFYLLLALHTIAVVLAAMR